jgi:hypothetical protein
MHIRNRGCRSADRIPYALFAVNADMRLGSEVVRHFDLNDLEVLACQHGVAFGYLDIGNANYFRS